jgi:hypothetical protein
LERELERILAEDEDNDWFAAVAGGSCAPVLGPDVELAYGFAEEMAPPAGGLPAGSSDDPAPFVAAPPTPPMPPLEEADEPGPGPGEAGAPAAKAKAKRKRKAAAKAKEAAGSPKAMAKAGAAKSYSTKTEHDTFEVDVRGDSLPVLKYDTKLNILSAHCRHPSHGRLCRLNRTLKENARDRDKGRPLGLLLAWIAIAGEFSTVQEHMQVARLPDVYIDERLSFANRKKWRLWLGDNDPVKYAAIQGLERNQRVAEDVEPEGPA